MISLIERERQALRQHLANSQGLQAIDSSVMEATMEDETLFSWKTARTSSDLDDLKDMVYTIISEYESVTAKYLKADTLLGIYKKLLTDLDSMDEASLVDLEKEDTIVTSFLDDVVNVLETVLADLSMPENKPPKSPSELIREFFVKVRNKMPCVRVNEALDGDYDFNPELIGGDLKSYIPRVSNSTSSDVDPDDVVFNEARPSQSFELLHCIKDCRLCMTNMNKVIRKVRFLLKVVAEQKLKEDTKKRNRFIGFKNNVFSKIKSLRKNSQSGADNKAVTRVTEKTDEIEQSFDEKTQKFETGDQECNKEKYESLKTWIANKWNGAKKSLASCLPKRQ